VRAAAAPLDPPVVVQEAVGILETRAQIVIAAGSAEDLVPALGMHGDSPAAVPEGGCTTIGALLTPPSVPSAGPPGEPAAVTVASALAAPLLTPKPGAGLVSDPVRPLPKPATPVPGTTGAR
jgi:hypothetical protein